MFSASLFAPPKYLLIIFPNNWKSYGWDDTKPGYSNWSSCPPNTDPKPAIIPIPNNPFGEFTANAAINLSKVETYKRGVVLNVLSDIGGFLEKKKGREVEGYEWCFDGMRLVERGLGVDVYLVVKGTRNMEERIEGGGELI